MKNNADTRFSHFTAEQTNLIKGVAILMIVLHNFYHNLTPTLGENEFFYYPGILPKYWALLLSSPESVLRICFSYLGHYGVQLFVFFNAYGVCRKYGGELPDARQFIWSRVSKIYGTFLLCIVIYVLLGLLKERLQGGEPLIVWNSIAWKLLLISNFVPDAGLSPVGPWWYVPFAIQLYVLLPLILRGFRRFGAAFLLVLALSALLLELTLNPYLAGQGLNVNFTIIGHMGVICLGIWLASRPSVDIRPAWLLLALPVFVAANLNRYVWLVSDLSFTVIALALSALAFKSSLGLPWLQRCLAFYGALSLHLFLVNGFLRAPFHAVAESRHQPWLDNAMALSSLLFGTACAFGFSNLDPMLRRALSRLLASTAGQRRAQ